MDVSSFAFQAEEQALHFDAFSEGVKSNLLFLGTAEGLVFFKIFQTFFNFFSGTDLYPLNIPIEVKCALLSPSDRITKEFLRRFLWVPDGEEGFVTDAGDLLSFPIHYIPPTYKKCSFNENLVLSKYILTFVWIFTSPHFSIWIFTSPHFSVWIFTSPHFSVWIFTSPHFSIWIFHFASLFHLDFHFAPLLCLDFHFAPLLGLDFPLRLTSPFGFSLRPTSQFGFSTLPHFSVWIFHFAPLLSLDFHFAPLLSLDFPLRPTSQFGFSTSPHFSESRRRT